MAPWVSSIARAERGTSLAETSLIISGVSVIILAVVRVFAGDVGEIWAGVTGLL